MLYLCVCTLACFSYTYLVFFSFKKPIIENNNDSEVDEDDTEQFRVIDITHTTSEIIHEMNIKSSTTKVQRWWRSVDIYSKRSLITELSHQTQKELNSISEQFTSRFVFYPTHNPIYQPIVSQSLYPLSLNNQVKYV